MKMSKRRGKKSWIEKKPADFAAKANDTDEVDIIDKKQCVYKNALEELVAELGVELGEKSGFKLVLVLPVALGHSQCMRLINAFTGGKDAFRNNLLARMIYATGITSEEEANLKGEDILFEEQRLHIHRGEGGREREIFIDRETLALLKTWMKGKKPADSVFSLTAARIDQIIEEAAVMTGIDTIFSAMGRRFSSRSLRHQYAIYSCERGMRIFTLHYILGQEYIQTTSMYPHAAMAAERSEYDAMGPFGNRRDEEGRLAERTSFSDILTAADAAFLPGRPRLYSSAREEILAEQAAEQGRGFRAPFKIAMPASTPTRDDCRQLIVAYKDEEFATRNNTMMRTFYASGVRIGEGRNLVGADINSENRTGFVRSGKGGRDRYVCIDDETLAQLKIWMKDRSPADSLFGISIPQLARVIEKAGRMTGVSPKYEALKRRFSPHSFRH